MNVMSRIALICFTASSLAVPLSGCVTDTSAVSTFSSLAPDNGKLNTLTQAYASVPSSLIAYDVNHELDKTSLDALNKDEATRLTQAKAIAALNEALIDYMKALGALANDSLVETSTDTASITAGLSSLQKAAPQLGITASQITAVGDLSTLLADAATRYYRQQQIAEVIARANDPLQSLVSVEIAIVQKGIVPDLTTERSRVAQMAAIEAGLSDDCSPVVSAKYFAESLKHKSKKQNNCPADVSSAFLLRRAMNSDEAQLDQQIAAANDYVTVLQKIAQAHAKLLAEGNDILTEDGAKAAIAQISPLVSDAYKAEQSLAKL